MTSMGITAAVIGCAAALLLLVLIRRDKSASVQVVPSPAKVTKASDEALAPVPVPGKPSAPKSPFKAYVHPSGQEPKPDPEGPGDW